MVSWIYRVLPQAEFPIFLNSPIRIISLMEETIHSQLYDNLLKYPCSLELPCKLDHFSPLPRICKFKSKSTYSRTFQQAHKQNNNSFAQYIGRKSNFPALKPLQIQVSPFKTTYMDSYAQKPISPRVRRRPADSILKMVDCQSLTKKSRSVIVPKRVTRQKSNQFPGNRSSKGQIQPKGLKPSQGKKGECLKSYPHAAKSLLKTFIHKLRI